MTAYTSPTMTETAAESYALATLLWADMTPRTHWEAKVTWPAYVPNPADEIGSEWTETFYFAKDRFDYTDEVIADLEAGFALHCEDEFLYALENEDISIMVGSVVMPAASPLDSIDMEAITRGVERAVAKHFNGR